MARIEESIAWTVMEMANDGSPMVRKEFVVFLSHFVLRFENKFLVAAYEHLQEEKEYLVSPPQGDGTEHRMGLHYAPAREPEQGRQHRADGPRAGAQHRLRGGMEVRPDPHRRPAPRGAA